MTAEEEQAMFDKMVALRAAPPCKVRLTERCKGFLRGDGWKKSGDEVELPAPEAPGALQRGPRGADRSGGLVQETGGGDPAGTRGTAAARSVRHRPDLEGQGPQGQASFSSQPCLRRWLDTLSHRRRRTDRVRCQKHRSNRTRTHSAGAEPAKNPLVGISPYGCSGPVGVFVNRTEA